MDTAKIDSYAKKNKPLPDGALTSDYLLWVTLCGLYHGFNSGSIAKDEAANIKRRAFQNHEHNAQGERIFREDSRRTVEIGKLLTAANKDGCPICKQISAIFDGRQREARL